MSTRFQLRLYVSDNSPYSTTVRANLQRLLEDLPHDLEVVDVSRTPERAATDRIIAIPTLMRLSPLPVRWIIGDMSDIGAVAAELQIGRFK